MSVELGQRLVAPCALAARSARQVVADDQLAVGLDARRSARRAAATSSRPSVPSSTTYCGDLVGDPADHLQPLHHATTSRTVTRSSISSADSVPVTSSSRSLYRSRVASAWLARDRIAAESSRTCRCPSTYRAMIRIDWLTEMTGKPVCLATRSAVRCRVPDSSVGIDGSGTSCTAARRIRVTSLDERRSRRPSCTARAAGSRRTRRPARSRRCTSPRPSCRSRARSGRRCGRAGSAPGRRAASVPGATAARVARSRSSASSARRHGHLPSQAARLVRSTGRAHGSGRSHVRHGIRGRRPASRRVASCRRSMRPGPVAACARLQRGRARRRPRTTAHPARGAGVRRCPAGDEGVR